ncbi:hypothetical protein DFH06DRAFT_1250299 [Mycena polygramma]|nr:hypothetical protein DFH06DRAFT_1250299 [Mycena polygramma]
MSSINLSDFPQDVLLELAKELDVADLLNFFSVCRAVREVQTHKTLWLSCLSQIGKFERHPPPISAGKELNTLSLPELQAAARKANQLIKNFRSENPRPARMRTVVVDVPNGILCIPGANLVIVHTGSSLSCWDVVTSQCVAKLEVHGLGMMSQQPCLVDIEGMALFSAVAVHDNAYLVAVNIDFRDRDHISIAHVVSPAIGVLPRVTPTTFFIKPRLVAVSLQGSDVFSWPIDADLEVQTIPRDLANLPVGIIDKAVGGCLAFGPTLYIFLGGALGVSATIQTVLLPFPTRRPTFNATAAHNNIITLAVPYPNGRSFADVLNAQGPHTVMFSPRVVMVVPRYGVAAVTLSSFRIIGEGFKMNLIHFWTGRIIADENIEFGQGYVYQPVDQICCMALPGTTTLQRNSDSTHDVPKTRCRPFSGIFLYPCRA